MNYLYGILTNGVVKEDVPGYRYTDVRRANSTHKLLTKIMGNKPEEVAAKADLIINLMRSVPTWVFFVKEFDPINTYEEKVYPQYGVINKNFYEDLKNWVDTVNVKHDLITVSIHDDFIQKLINIFYIIATSK